MGTTTHIETPDGGCDAYLATPSTPPGPPLVALHAWWGLNQDFRDFCDRLAGDGFTVLAPDLFDGAVLGTIEEAEQFGEQLDEEHNAERLLGRAASALEHVLTLSQTRGSRAAVLGFSFGTSYARWLAMLRPEVAAIVTYYGGTWVPEGEPSRAQWLSHWAEDDPYEDADDARAAVAAAADAGAVSHFYDGTRHWFAEPGRPEFVQAASDLAYRRTVDFLRQTLNGSAG
ncbi:MAG TPA: dienelactone hydrolase family protein [Candidatus Limnocylindria bacterium]